MTQQDKDLLLRDLCARLPYNPVVYVDERLPRLRIGASTRIWEYVSVDNPCKPYLRPMSSMTEKELREYKCKNDALDENYEVHIDNAYPAFDWLNAHHFDYRGLIEKGLAIEVTKENNPYRL